MSPPPDSLPSRQQSKILHRPLSNPGPLSDRFNSTRFPLILLTLSAFAYPVLATESNNESAIKTSSDVWATLVANIAPLLLLVGENHVKAYFKTIRNPSHCLLYAVGPIGIITAITTLIRLTGIRTLKRLIGRQYESFPTVLADVTSVCKGDIAFEIRNDRLEQTITPGNSKDDVAIFYLRARKKGKYEELHNLTQKAMLSIEHNCVPSNVPIEHDGVPPNASMAITPEWFAVVGLFQTKIAMDDDEGATTVQKMRELIMNRLFESSVQWLNLDRGSGFEHISGFIEIFTGWEGISPSLTACFNSEQPLINGVRFMISLLCILGYIGIIIGNWFVQRDPQNTVLITVGLTISTLGAYYTANMVNSQSTETRTKLDFMEDLKLTPVCGYYSSRGRYGSLKAFPKSIISSAKAKYAGSARHLFPEHDPELGRRLAGRPDNNLSPYASRALWVARPTVIVVAMTLGYVGLYLGLRTAKWWASLSLLAISAVASVARVLLVTDHQEFMVWRNMSGNPEAIVNVAHANDTLLDRELDREPDVCTSTPWPWTNPARMAKANFMDCRQSDPSGIEGPIKAPLTPPDVTTDRNPGTDDSTIPIGQLLRPAIIPNQHYTILTAKCRHIARVNVGGEFQDDSLDQRFFANLMHGSLLIAKELYSRSLIPRELGSMAHNLQRLRHGDSFGQGQQRLDSKTVLLSDIIAQDGVWRQTLELVLNVGHSTPEISLNECSVHLGFWWLHAQKLRDTASEINAIRISTDHPDDGGADSTYIQDNRDTIPGDEEDDRGYSSRYRDDHIPPRAFRDYIWMGAKICFVLVKKDPRPEKVLQDLLQRMNDKNHNLNLQKEEAKSVVDCMKEICLAVPRPATGPL